MPKRLSKGRPTLRDIRDLNSGKYDTRMWVLILGIVLVLCFAGIGLYAFALSMQTGVSPAVLLQGAALNLSTEVFGAAIIFLLINLFWERRSKKLEDERRRVERARSELNAGIARIFREWEEDLASQGLVWSDFTQDLDELPIDEAVRQVKARKFGSPARNSGTEDADG